MTKSKNGRPRKELEDISFNGWDQLDALIVWASEVYCANQLKISVDSLARRIKEKTGLSFAEYKLQKSEPMRINLLKKQYDIAMNGNCTMLIWLGKQHLGQTDKSEIKSETTGMLTLERFIAKSSENLKKEIVDGD